MITETCFRSTEGRKNIDGNDKRLRGIVEGMMGSIKNEKGCLRAACGRCTSDGAADLKATDSLALLAGKRASSPQLPSASMERFF
jgi:hypothetical protein